MARQLYDKTLCLNYIVHLQNTNLSVLTLLGQRDWCAHISESLDTWRPGMQNPGVYLCSGFVGAWTYLVPSLLHS